MGAITHGLGISYYTHLECFDTEQHSTCMCSSSYTCLHSMPGFSIASFTSLYMVSRKRMRVRKRLKFQDHHTTPHLHDYQQARGLCACLPEVGFDVLRSPQSKRCPRSGRTIYLRRTPAIDCPPFPFQISSHTRLRNGLGLKSPLRYGCWPFCWPVTCNMLPVHVPVTCMCCLKAWKPEILITKQCP